MTNKSDLIQNFLKLLEAKEVSSSCKGLINHERRLVLAKQLADSVRRIQYVKTLGTRGVSELRANPYSELFDPLKAAIHFKNREEIDEAFWLVFLATHFGKSTTSGWRLCSDIYGAMGNQEIWTWRRVCSDLNGFREWYGQASRQMASDGIVRRFSNHRKFESLKPDTAKSVPNVVESYVHWVGGHNSHVARLEEALYAIGHDSELLFGYLYESIQRNVLSFGRLASFDHVTMLSKIGLVEAYPQIAYLADSSGPRQGASLLIYGHKGDMRSAAMEAKLKDLAKTLNLGDFAMQILEDALCNWQKNPEVYKYFRG